MPVRVEAAAPPDHPLLLLISSQCKELLLALLLSLVSEHAAVAKPTIDCRGFAAKMDVQFELQQGVFKNETYPSKRGVSIAEDLVTGGYGMTRAQLQARVPGFYDWAVLAVLRAWESGATKPGYGGDFGPALLTACRAEFD
jgi:hypothetical protein